VPSSVSPPRPLSKAESGRLGALAKWGDRYVPVKVRLDDLTIPQRRLVVALVEAAKAEQASGGDG
jgi:hypothetical protein